MHLEHLPGNLEKRSLEYRLGEPCSDAALEAASARIGAALPDQLVTLYRHYDGLEIVDPPVCILPIDELRRDAAGLVRFATFDGRHHVALDTSTLNAAEQWTIVAEASGFEITLTLGSFWSNKLFKWLDKRREIWLPGHEVG